MNLNLYISQKIFSKDRFLEEELLGQILFTVLSLWMHIATFTIRKLENLYTSPALYIILFPELFSEYVITWFVCLKQLPTWETTTNLPLIIFKWIVSLKFFLSYYLIVFCLSASGYLQDWSVTRMTTDVIFSTGNSTTMEANCSSSFAHSQLKYLKPSLITTLALSLSWCTSAGITVSVHRCQNWNIHAEINWVGRQK